MARFEPRNPDYEARVRDSFSRQAFMGLIGAAVDEVAPGRVTVSVASRPDLCQQHGYIHAGVVTTIADNAAGYAALSLFDAGSSVLTTELKISLLAPARGERLIARAEVIKPGKTLTACRADVFAVENGEETLVAALLLSMMRMAGMADAAPPRAPAATKA